MRDCINFIIVWCYWVLCISEMNGLQDMIHNRTFMTLAKTRSDNAMHGTEVNEYN